MPWILTLFLITPGTYMTAEVAGFTSQNSCTTYGRAVLAALGDKQVVFTCSIKTEV